LEHSSAERFAGPAHADGSSSSFVSSGLGSAGVYFYAEGKKADAGD